MEPSPKHPTVRPPQGMLASTFLASWLFGIAFIACVAGLLALDDWFGSGILSIFALPLPFVALLALTPGRTHPSWKVRWVVFAAGSLSVGLTVGMGVGLAFQTPNIESPLPLLWGSFGFLPYVVGFTLLVWVPIWGMRRLKYIRTLDALPNRCFPCSYDLSGLAADAACPECGRDRREHPGRVRFVISSDRLRRSLMIGSIALCVAGPLVFLTRWSVEMLPLRHRLAAMGSEEYFGLPWTMPAPKGVSQGGNGVIVRSKAHPERILAVAVPRKVGPNRPPMRVWLAVHDHIAGNPDHPKFALEIDPPVICNLDKDQADRVAASGLPADLVEAMYAAGAASTNGVTFLNWEEFSAMLKPPVTVDPAPYFR